VRERGNMRERERERETERERDRSEHGCQLAFFETVCQKKKWFGH